MKVEQIMTRDVCSVTPADHLSDAARLMWERDCGVVPVVLDDGVGRQVVGMLSDRDVCMAAYTQGRPLRDIPVASAMSRRVCSCRPTDTITVALKVLETNQLRRLPVVDADEHLVGLLSLADLAREAAHERGQRAKHVKADTVGEALEAICRPHQPARDLVAKVSAA